MFKTSMLSLFMILGASFSLMGAQHDQAINNFNMINQQHTANIVMEKRYQWLQGSLFLLPAAALAAIIYKGISDRGIDLFEGMGYSAVFSVIGVFTHQTFTIIATKQSELAKKNTELRTELSILNK